MPNIEIKAKCNNVVYAKQIANKLKTDYLGELHQVDTYFSANKGRLKLREINGKESQLIPYFKEYSAGPMKSNYTVLPVMDTIGTKNILDKILGIVAVVDKKREVFLIDNVRIHLDNVLDLGTFIEFEAVYKEESNKEKEVKKISELMDVFRIRDEALLDKSYIDYIFSLDSMFNNLEILYSFEGESLIVSEIKRKDIDKSASAEKRLFWMMFDKDNKQLSRLDFCSMSTEGNNEKREFFHGSLEFNSLEANFQIDNKNFKLYTQKVLDKDYIDAVTAYFKNIK